MHLHLEQMIKPLTVIAFSQHQMHYILMPYISKIPKVICNGQSEAYTEDHER